MIGRVVVSPAGAGGLATGGGTMDTLGAVIDRPAGACVDIYNLDLKIM